MDDDYGCEDLWDDAEEFERDELAQDHEDWDEDWDEDEVEPINPEGDTGPNYEPDSDLDTDAFEDWRDDCNLVTEIEDADIYGDPMHW